MRTLALALILAYMVLDVLAAPTSPVIELDDSTTPKQAAQYIIHQFYYQYDTQIESIVEEVDNILEYIKEKLPENYFDSESPNNYQEIEKFLTVYRKQIELFDHTCGIIPLLIQNGSKYEKVIERLETDDEELKSKLQTLIGLINITDQVVARMERAQKLRAFLRTKDKSFSDQLNKKLIEFHETTCGPYRDLAKELRVLNYGKIQYF